jgi:hypothetical protein
MKTLILSLSILAISLTGFGQDLRNHDVSLEGKKWSKISPSQMTDTVNLNQTGNEQWEYLMFYSNVQDENVIDSIISSQTDIFGLIATFGKPEIDISSMSATDIIEPLSGFYYSIQKNRYPEDSTVVIEVIYPRRDAY